jgi:hypothetical protein
MSVVSVDGLYLFNSEFSVKLSGAACRDSWGDLFGYRDLDSLIASRISLVVAEVFTPGTSNGDFCVFL